MIRRPGETVWIQTAGAWVTGLAGTIGYRVMQGQTTVIARTTSGVVETIAGSGIYGASITAPATEGWYQVTWDAPGRGYSTPEDLGVFAGGSDPLSTPVPGGYAVGTAAAALARIGTGQISTAVPVAVDGSVSVVHGDSYLAADGRRLEWTQATGGSWPTNLTGWTVTFTVKTRDGVQVLQKTGAVVTPTGTQKVGVELAPADYTGLTRGTSYRFDIQATGPGGAIATLVRGSLTDLPDVT